MTIQCGVKYPYLAEVFCERPGEGPQANHPEHTGWAGGESLGVLNGAVSHVAYWVDWANTEYVKPARSAKVTGRRSKNPLKFQQTINEIAQRTRGGKDEKAN